jgi:hypothetical protein
MSMTMGGIHTQEQAMTMGFVDHDYPYRAKVSGLSKVMLAVKLVHGA